MYKTWKFALLLAVLAAALSACADNGGNDEANGTGEQPPAASADETTAGDTDGEAPKDSAEAPDEQPAEEPAGDGTGQTPEAVDLPETKKLEVVLEGNPESVSAKLMKSDQGYSFYLIEGYEFTPEEPGKDMIFHKNFPEFYMRVEMLPADANLDDLKKNAEDTLKNLGEVVSFEGEQIADAVVRENAKFFYHASNSEVSQNITVVDFGGALLRFTLNFPNSEASEGVSPLFYTMIDTFVVNK